MVFQIFLKPFQIFLKNVEIHGRTDELYAGRVLRTTCAASCTPVASFPSWLAYATEAAHTECA